MIVHKNLKNYQVVVAAWRLARWANHAWGNIPDGALAEVWNIAPTLSAFVQLFPGYAIAKNWIIEGPCGFGIVGPDLATDEYGLTVSIGSGCEVLLTAERLVATYRHRERSCRLGVDWNGQVIEAEGMYAKPRDWARVARVLLVALDFDDEFEPGRSIIGTARALAGEDSEFERYILLRDTDIFVGPSA